MLKIVPFTSEWSPAVQAFNARLTARGLEASLQFPETPDPEYPVHRPEDPLYQEYFLVVEDDQVHGGYFLTQERWLIHGQVQVVGNYRLPLSEGLVDPVFRGVSLSILRHALMHQPLMYCLGMGSWDRPLPRSLKAVKWGMFSTPFFFRSLNPSRVLRNLTSLRRSPLRRLIFNTAAATGAGSLGIQAMQSLKMVRGSDTLRVTVANEFSSWAGDIWQRVRGDYLCLAVRDSSILRIRYPREDARFIRLRMDDASGPAAWAILIDTQMSGHHHFGDLRVGTIVDCFGVVDYAGEVVRKAAAELERRGVDLIVSNQSHRVWCHAFRESGFLPGPSNRIMAASPGLAELMAPFDRIRSEAHLTRGDAAGPIHL